MLMRQRLYTEWQSQIEAQMERVRQRERSFGSPAPSAAADIHGLNV